MAETTNLVIYAPDLNVDGWSPIGHMVELMAGCLNATLEQQAPPVSRLGHVTSRLWMPAQNATAGALFVVRTPKEIPACLRSSSFRRPHAFRCLWIIDSFWTEWLTKAQKLRDFDLVIYTQAYDREIYEALIGKKAICLPWGTDALGLGKAPTTRTLDLLRVGRQPDAWDNDAETAEDATRSSLRFHGRPPGNAGSEGYKRLLSDWYAKTKYVLAQSNLVDSSSYTHPQKEYITARWTDALACGASIAGAIPGQDTQLIDWPGALLDFTRLSRQDALATLSEALEIWTPDTARTNHLNALQRLDWRWRFQNLANALDLKAPALDRDLEALKSRIADLTSTVPAS